MKLKRTLPAIAVAIAVALAALALPASASATPTAPSFTSTPNWLNSSTSFDFTLSGVESGATVLCSVDYGSYSAESCNSSDPTQIHLSGLSDGFHTISVVQFQDPADQSPAASVSWTVDATAPAAPTVSTPQQGGHTAADFTLGASAESGSRLQCRVDADPALGVWGLCPGIGDGTTFNVGWQTQLHWGEDLNSNPRWVIGFGAMNEADCESGWDPVRNVCWTQWFYGSLDTTTVENAFLGLGSADCSSYSGNFPTSMLAFGQTTEEREILSWNRFSLDCSDTTTAAVTAAFKDLSAGSHTLELRALDRVGNASDPTTVTWTVDRAPADTQTDDNGNVFVNAGVLEFGAKANGSFGSAGSAPGDFHQRTEANPGTGLSNGLGFVAPADPVTRDWSNQLGDFFTPGDPYEGWTITANGNVSGGNDQSGMSGHWDAVSASDHSATWHADAAFEGLDISMTYSTPGTDQLINGTVTLANNSGSDVADVAYSRGVDPDNCVMDRLASNSGSDPYYTTNTIWSQYGLDAAAISVITADETCDNETRLALSSGDPGSRVGVSRNDWARMTNPFDLLNSDGTGYAVDPGDSIEGDYDMNVAIPANPDHGNVIRDGETVTLHFTYSLSKPALKSLGVPDIAPPRITGKPDRYSNSATATFNFAGADGATFDCALDDGAWEHCAAETVFNNLSEGDHVVLVSQTVAPSTLDGGFTGLPQISGTSRYSWTVDTTRPGNVTLTSAPNGRTTATDATLTFTGDPDSTFECQFNAGEWFPCSSPWKLSGLSGENVGAVRQRDRAGNVSYGEAAGWTVVDALPPAAPVIKGAPYLATQSGYANLVISAERDTTLECSVDNGSWAACGTLVPDPVTWNRTLTLNGLSAGSHTLSARATGAAGTGDAASVTWTVGVATQALVFPSAPTVKAIKPKSGHWTISLAVDTGSDTRPAAQPLTVQVWSQAKRPSPTMAPPKRPTAINKVVRFSTSIRWNGAAKPRWLRVGNRAGRWSGWQQIVSG